MQEGSRYFQPVEERLAGGGIDKRNLADQIWIIEW